MIVNVKDSRVAIGKRYGKQDYGLVMKEGEKEMKTLKEVACGKTVRIKETDW